MSLGCGPCNLCCKLLAVPDIGKPACMTCWWTGLHGGCAKQAEKASDPSLAACAQYKCVWLESQSYENPELRQPRDMRPNHTHVVMGVPDPDKDQILHVHVDPEHSSAWREAGVSYYLNDFISRGATIEIHIGPDVKFVLDEAF